MQSEVAALVGGAAEDQRVGGPEHGMQVQQEVRGVDERADFARAVEFGGTADAEKLRIVPDAVEVFFDIARGERVGGVEPVEGGEVGEAEGEAAAKRA